MGIRKKTCLALLSNIPLHQKEIICMTILQMQLFIDDIYIIDFYKDRKLQKILSNESNIIKAEQWNYDNWSDIYRHYKDMLKDFENVIIFNAPTIRDISLLDINKNIKKDNRYKMQHDKMRRIIERLLFVISARDKNVIHLCIDNQEVNFNENWKFKSYKRVCKVQSDKCKDIIGPIFENAMVKTYIQEIPKAQNLYYVASLGNKERNYIRGYTEEINKRFGKREKGGYSRVISEDKHWTNPTKGLCSLYNDKELKNNRVSQEEYYYNLMLSKYTLINAPYDKSVFNFVRFIEAVIFNCVPLILPDNNMSNLKLTYPDFYDIIYKRYLVEDVEHIHRRVRNYDKDKICLSEFRRTKSFHKITDDIYIKNFYNKLLK